MHFEKSHFDYLVKYKRFDACQFNYLAKYAFLRVPFWLFS